MEDILKWIFQKILRWSQSLKLKMLTFLANSLPFTLQMCYVYHLRDDATHDSFFVHQVLTDVITKWDVGNETVIMKNDNAPT